LEAFIVRHAVMILFIYTATRCLFGREFLTPTFEFFCPTIDFLIPSLEFRNPTMEFFCPTVEFLTQSLEFPNLEVLPLAKLH
jgi:hypothetical protein